MSKHNITVSNNDKQVYAHLVQSPIAARLARQPHLLTLLKEALTPLELKGSEIYLEQDMGRQIGYSDIIETREKDVIFYAQQMRSSGFTRFVKNRKTAPTQYLTIKLRQDAEDSYEVVDAWIGKKFPPLPDAEQATNTSKTYWEDHAVVFNGQAIMASTTTKDCPY